MTDEQKRLVNGALVDADHLATCCEKMLAAMNRHHAAVERGEVADEADIEACASALVELEQAEAEVSEYWRAIRSAAYEYRKRAERARAALMPNFVLGRQFCRVTSGCRITCSASDCLDT